MRFVLYSSLHELAGSRWLQQHSLDTSSTTPRHSSDNDQGDDEDQPLPNSSHSEPDNETNDIGSAFQSFQAWTRQLQDASTHSQQLAAAGQQQPTAPAFPLVPHKQLLLLAEGLQQVNSEAAGVSSTKPSTAAMSLISNSVPLCKALKQLASASETLWTVAAEAATAAAAAVVVPASPHQPATAAAGPPLRSTSPASHNHRSPGPAATPPRANTSAEDGTGTAPDSAAAPAAAVAVDVEGLKQLLFWACHLTAASHEFYTATAAAATPAPAPAGRHKAAASKPPPPPQQQHLQHWLQHVLPALLQALLACARLLAGNVENAAAAAAGAGAAPSSCVLRSVKDQAAADKLLLAICLSVATTSSSRSQCATTTKRPSKSSSSSSSASTATLPGSCLQLAAGIYGCHLLYRHRQLLQQQISSSQLSQELNRLLQDHQQQYPQVKEMLVTALSGLLQAASTAQRGAQLLCVLAGEVFPEHHQQGPEPQRRKQQPRKQQQQQDAIPAAAFAAAEAASRTDAVLLQLELLTLVLSAEPGIAAAAASAAGSSGTAFCQVAALLAAAMLPVLLPAALMTNAAVRRLWLSIASTAADAASTAAATAAAGMAAAVEAHSAGVAALAAAARWDKDANIRSKALGLLIAAVPCMWLHLAMGGHMQSEQQPQQQQQQHANNQDPSTTEAAAGGRRSSSSSSSRSSSSCAAVTAALQAQLTGRSKSCRAKALQLLQQLLSDPSAVLTAAVQHAQQQPQNAVDQLLNQQHIAHLPISASSCKQYVVQWQQQLVADTFPCLAALLAAPQDSLLHCPASKAAAKELVPCMAQLLQPQQALQLALDSSAACGSNDAAAAGQLLGSLSQCSEAEVYAVLRQQLAALDGTAYAGSTQQKQQHTQGSVLLRQLQRLLAAGSCCNEPLRRHAFLAVCEALNAAADSSLDSETAQPTSLQQQQQPRGGQGERQQQQQASLQEAAVQLLLAVQLLELAGGCSSPLQQPRDFRGELAILADALDWCCFCMQCTSAAAAAAAAAAGRTARDTAGVAAAAAMGMMPAEGGPMLEVEAEAAGVVCMEGDEHQQQQQQPHHRQDKQPEQLQQQLFAVTMGTLQELLASLLRILYSAADAAAAAAANSKRPASSASSGMRLNPEASSGVGQLLLAGLGSTLLHHLELVVSLTACGAESAAALPAQLPVEVLEQYIQVLCVANTGRQFLLHELLLHWHKELASNPPPPSVPTTAAAAAATTAGAKRHAKLIALLLLMQHLSGFYKTEQQRFKQGLAATLRASGAAAGAAAPAVNGAAVDGDEAAAISAAAGAAAAAPKRAAARKRASDGRPCPQQLQVDDLSSPYDRQTAAADQVAAAGTADEQSNLGGAAFDCMLGEEERQWVEESTAKFTSGLLEETAPACYLPMLLQLLALAEVPTHVKVLALQALQPLLLISPALSQQHSTLLEALLADPGTPAGLQLQAVTAASQLIAARPAQSQGLVLQLEQLLLRGLAAAELQTMTSPAAPVERGTDDLQLDPSHAAETHAELPGDVVDVLCCAAGVYAVLLLGERLLLAPRSWKVVAAGLLAAEHLQAVSQTMQQLLQCLLAQQHLSCVKAALGLLLNCTDTQPDPQQLASTARPSSAASGSAVHGLVNSSSNRALQLVQDHLLVFLTPKDLASDELQLPLLAALGQAAQGGGWGRAVQPLAALLAACCPSVRCLDTLASALQASKHSLSLHSCPDALAQLTTYASNYKPANSGRAAGEAAAEDEEAADCEDEPAAAAGVGGGRAARGKAAAGSSKKAGARRGKAAAQQQGLAGGCVSGAVAVQAKLLQLLSEVTAAVEGGAAGAGAGNGTSSRAKKRRAAAQLPPAQPPAVAGAGVGSAGAGVEAGQAAELQRLAVERRQQLQQYRAAKK